MPKLLLTELLFAIRAVHVLTGLGWLGEVIVVNFVLVPVLLHAKPRTGSLYLWSFDPRIAAEATSVSDCIP